jgi:hypothetical protein
MGNWDSRLADTMPKLLLAGIYTPRENVGYFLNRPYLWFMDPVLPRTGVYFAIHNYMYWKLPSPSQEMLKQIRQGKEPWRVPLQATVKVFQNTREDIVFGGHWHRELFEGVPYWWMHSHWGFMGMQGYKIKE